MWKFIKRHKILLSGATILMIVALLGIQVTPVPISKTSHAVSIGSGQKYEVTIADKVLAAGLTADYTCNGTNDNVIWQNAINAVPANGGIVNDLTGGLYVFAATVNVPAKVTINGIGRASYFSNNGVTAIFTSTGNGTCYQNISTDNGGINTGATTGWLETNVAVGTTLYTERSPNSSLVDSTLSLPTGRTASYVIAASNSSAVQKSQADVTDTTGTGLATILASAIASGYRNIHLASGNFATSGLTGVSGLNLTGEWSGLGSAAQFGTQGTQIILNAGATLLNMSSCNVWTISNIYFSGGGQTGALVDTSLTNGGIFNQCTFYQGIPATTSNCGQHLRFVNCSWSSCGSGGTAQNNISNNTGGLNVSDWWFENCTWEPNLGNAFYFDGSGAGVANTNFNFITPKFENHNNQFAFITTSNNLVYNIKINGGNLVNSNTSGFINGYLANSVIRDAMLDNHAGGSAFSIVFGGTSAGNIVDACNFQNTTGANAISLTAGTVNNLIQNNVGYDAGYVICKPMVSDASTAKSNIVLNNQGTPNYPLTGTTNLLANGSFENAAALGSWSTWTSGTATFTKSATFAKFGTNSAKIDCTIIGTSILYQAISNPTAYIGQWITFSAWVKDSVASNTRFDLATAGTATDNYSTYHSGGGGWELLSISCYIPAGTISITCNVDTVKVSTVYVDGAMCVEGRTVTDFAPMPANAATE